ncbi:hypothetical protein F4802DRAFT_615307 [Xylaria palmicola]|nr:hypothetical protein F4802DRAFT_615307 [Xylaria palmicola]
MEAPISRTVTPLSLSFGMMDEPIPVSPSSARDPRGTYMQFLSAAPDSDNISVLDFPWVPLTRDARYSPGPCLEDVAEELDAVHPDVGAYTFAHDGFKSRSEPEPPPENPILSLEGRIVAPQVEERGPTIATYITPDQAGPTTTTLSESIEARDTTSSEPNRASTTSPGRTTSTSSISSVDLGGAPGIKQHRERNRVAARKCRQKAKQNIAGLQRREKELGQQNRMLQSYVSSLRDEILDLKTEILRHSTCNNAVIQTYISNAARRQMQ